MAGRYPPNYPYPTNYGPYRGVGVYPMAPAMSAAYQMQASFGGYRDDRRQESLYRPPLPPQRTSSGAAGKKRSSSPGRHGGGGGPYGSKANASRIGNEGRHGGSSSHGGRYEVTTPTEALINKEICVADLRRRFHRLYVPSDFFHGDLAWQECFPSTHPYRLGNHCEFQIFNKEVDFPNAPVEHDNPAYLEPLDADYSYSAKVMLLSSADLTTFYQQTIRMADEKSINNDKQAWTKQLHFLVGTRGKSEVMPIGGPWSPSLDGQDPAEDPQVLINTAIRSCKAQTGIDLSSCTRWLKFLELHYYRPADRVRSRVKPSCKIDTVDEETTTSATTSLVGGGGSIENLNSSDRDHHRHHQHLPEDRVETVAIFLPDIHNCMPQQMDDWLNRCNIYKELLEVKLSPPKQPEEQQQLETTIGNTAPPPAATAAATTATTSINGDGGGENHNNTERELAGNTVDDVAAEETLPEEDSKQDDVDKKLQPTHYTKLDINLLKVAQLRVELEARGIDSKGLKSQLMAKLEAVLKEEERKEKEVATVSKQEKDEATGEEASKELTEKDRRRLERLYRVDETKPSIIVHPSRRARNGTYSCEKVSLHTLLEYRTDDQKEHTFEVSLFAEQFRDMIHRDAAFNIYKALVVAPEPTSCALPPATTGTPTALDKSTLEANAEEPSSKRRRGDSVSGGGEKKKQTIHPDLLFSFNVFDYAGNCDYIKENDMETIIYSLGLNLSRSQVRKLISKVQTSSLSSTTTTATTITSVTNINSNMINKDRKDFIYYRKLTDKEVSDGNVEEIVMMNSNNLLNPALDDADYIEELALGNRALFDENAYRSTKEHVVICTAECDQLVSKIQQSEDARRDYEMKFFSLKDTIDICRKELNVTKDEEDKIRLNVKKLRDDLSKDLENLKEVRSTNRIYHRLLETSQEYTARVFRDIDKHFEKEQQAKAEELALKNQQQQEGIAATNTGNDAKEEGQDGLVKGGEVRKVDEGMEIEAKAFEVVDSA